MHRLCTILAGFGAGLLLASCGGASPTSTLKSIAYGDPTKPYLGMSQSEIIACAGQPHARYRSSGGETLTYRYSGAGPRPGAAPKPDKKKAKPSIADSLREKGGDGWTCTASLAFENDRLARISYAHKDVRSPYAHLSEKNPEKARQIEEEGVPTCSFVLPPSCGR